MAGSAAVFHAWPRAAMLLVVMALAAGCVESEGLDDVRVVSLPLAGVNPDVALDSAGNLRVVFVAGDNAYHAASRDQGVTFSEPTVVNQPPAEAQGGMFRGPELAIGADDVAHVAWYSRARPLDRPPTQQAAMYSSGAASFGPGRNLSLDPADGVSIAVAGRDVVVAWHTDDRLQLASSTDGGASFSTPADLDALPCECCDTGLSLQPGGPLYVAYRDRKGNNRDMFLVEVALRSLGQRRLRLDTDEWQIDACPMSNVGLVRHGGEMIVVWEHKGQVLMSQVDLGRWTRSPPLKVADHGKYPVIASNGKAIVVAWKRNRELHWRTYDAATLQTRREGRADSASSHRPAVAALPDGSFVVIP